MRVRVVGGTAAALEADLVRRAGTLLGTRVVVEGPGIPALGIPEGAEPTDLPAIEVDGGDLPAGEPMEVRFAYVGGTDLALLRARVAAAAELPSEPLDPATRERVLQAAAQRDWRAVVQAVEECDRSVFETLAWADRLLAVDLAADVGR